LGDPELAADVAHSHASRDLLQDRRNLLDGKALSLHGTPSWPVDRIVPRNSPSGWTEKSGAPQHVCCSAPTSRRQANSIKQVCLSPRLRRPARGEGEVSDSPDQRAVVASSSWA